MNEDIEIDIFPFIEINIFHLLVILNIQDHLFWSWKKEKGGDWGERRLKGKNENK